ncbi:hypothetical protein [Enterocloster citroniae]|uniref:hypothetical protein n=1 Tax=Enterocloster citroniae TaxID=358743 RepID=UPI00349E88D1
MYPAIREKEHGEQGAIGEISFRLREELPGLRGFSSGNIKLMRQFFEAWQPYFSSSQDDGANPKTIATATDLKMGNEVLKAAWANR